jgi:hypothetical protein
VARCRVLCVCCLCCALICVGAPAVAGAAETAAGWHKPVDGDLVRAFDPPQSHYGAGHLGADFRTPSGTPVRAAGPGEVTFAGSIAGAVHVVVAHAGRLRTSYSYLTAASVRRGDAVRTGAVLGTSGGTGVNHDGQVLHFGLRSGDEYLDPMLLFGAVDLARVVHLAPTAAPFGYTVAEERRGLLAGLHDFGAGVVDAAAGVGGAVADLTPDVDAITAALTPAADLARAMSGRYEERIRRVLVGFPPTGAYSAAFSASLILYAYLQQGAHCDDHAPPADGSGGSGHRVMLVAGIGSGTGDNGRTTAIPAERLGYAPEEISAFSYAADGGPYTKGDTYSPLLTSARRLADQLRAQQRIDPGREVDLIAHSQGGVVALAFLKLVYDPADSTYPPLGKVITLSAPLQGAPLATLADEIRDVPGAGPQGLNLIDAAPGPIPDLDTRAVEDLAEDSPFMAQLDAARLPESVELTTIGSLFDYVVPADRATVGGAQHTIIDAGLRDPHKDVQTDDEALMAMRSALEGRPLPCQSLRDVVRASLIPPAITLAETLPGGFPLTTGFVVPR